MLAREWIVGRAASVMGVTLSIDQGGGKQGGHALAKSSIIIEPPADKKRADECPKYAQPSVRVAVTEAKQSTKCNCE